MMHLRKWDWPPSVRWIRRMVVVGLLLSVASLVVTLGVVAGFSETFQQKILAFHPHITLNFQGSNPISAAALAKVWKQSGLPEEALLKSEPVLYREALLVHGETIRGGLLKGVSQQSGIVLGKVLAEKLGIAQSPAELRLLLPVAGGETPTKMATLSMTGTFQTGLYELDEQFALLPLAQLQQLFGLTKNDYSLEIQIADPFRAQDFAAVLENHLDPTVAVENWIDLYRPLFSAFELEHWFFRIVIGFMILVAAINLVAAILLSIYHRKRELMILKVLGLSAKGIVGLFTREGLWLGGIGMLSGALLGVAILEVLKHFPLVAIDPEVYFLDRLPVAVPWPELVLLVAATGGFLWLVSRLTARSALQIPVREGLHEPG